jgi:hypothetical protein
MKTKNINNTEYSVYDIYVIWIRIPLTKNIGIDKLIHHRWIYRRYLWINLRCTRTYKSYHLFSIFSIHKIGFYNAFQSKFSNIFNKLFIFLYRYRAIEGILVFNQFSGLLAILWTLKPKEYPLGRPAKNIKFNFHEDLARLRNFKSLLNCRKKNQLNWIRPPRSP